MCVQARGHTGLQLDPEIFARLLACNVHPELVRVALDVGRLR